MSKYTAQLKDVLEETVKENASDLHISVGNYPTLRVAGKLIPLIKKKKVSSEDAWGLALELTNDIQHHKLLKEKEVDFSYELEKKARFRINVFFQKGYISIAMRLIPAEIRTIEDLNLPLMMHDFAKANQGFVLVTGPSSHGKSTTLAALIDEINSTRADHIITIEDPIEYVFKDKKSLVDQREIHLDALSFPKALRSVFRQDPDVIMVGEMRDPETISTAITAAETGHLVFATLHTNSASQSIHRIIDSFPAAQQSQVRSQLSASLLGVVSQRLIPRAKGGLVPACEILVANPAISNLIRENKIHEIPLVIETSLDAGMRSLNRSLANLVKSKEITLESAYNYSINPAELKDLVKVLK